MRFFPALTPDEIAQLPRDLAALIATGLFSLAMTGWIPALPALVASLG